MQKKVKVSSSSLFGLTHRMMRRSMIFQVTSSEGAPGLSVASVHIEILEQFVAAGNAALDELVAGLV
jgi:hypothetical protein